MNDDELPRRRKPPLPLRQLVTIAVTIACLVAILILKQRCGAATAQLFQAISSTVDGGARD